MEKDRQNSLANSRVVSCAQTAGEMTAARIRFMGELGPDLRGRVQYPLQDPERQRWHFVPREMFTRQGVCLKEMTPRQRQAAMSLLSTGLSQSGLTKARSIMEMEDILAEMEKAAGQRRFQRDPDLYYFTVFGDSGQGPPWAWRAEGHHLSLSYTVAGLEYLSVTPSFFGANPAEVRHGPRQGLRVLSEEEDRARQLLAALSPKQKPQALIANQAPEDILSKGTPRVELECCAGLAGKLMTSVQREFLGGLIEVYLRRLPEGLAQAQREKLTLSGLDQIHFAWAGGQEPGQPHYYRVHGRPILIEYDNTQDQANHIHTVWRDPENDFGLDYLRMHYERGHHRQ
jgi:hypothetical protein